MSKLNIVSEPRRVLAAPTVIDAEPATCDEVPDDAASTVEPHHELPIAPDNVTVINEKLKLWRKLGES